MLHMAKGNRRLYVIPVFSKALDVMELMGRDTAPFTVDALHKLTKIPKTTVYRILQTLLHRGYAVHGADGSYKLVSRPKKVRFGFAGQSSDMPFSVAVTASLTAAAAQSGVDLVVLDNRYDAQTAVENAHKLIKSNVDLIIEFQVEQTVAATIGNMIAEAGIPLIAIDIPHPNAVYFGVDNYKVGLAAGELLAHHARRTWSGKVDWVLGLDLPEAGALVQSRITGSFDKVHELLPELPVECFVRMDGRGMRDTSRTAVLEFLKRHPKDHRILIAASTDSSALGAIDAARDLRREKDVAVTGQDCISEANDEMQNVSSPLIGTVSHEIQSYGPALIRLGLTMLNGGIIAPYNYVEHRIVKKSAATSRNSSAKKKS